MVFFMTELMCRPVWEQFFPEGEFIHMTSVFRVKLWPRILIIFLMTSLLPLMDMAFVSYQKAEMMLTTDPAEVLRSLMFLIIFLLGIECSLVVLLSMFMSRSIVAPILDLKDAMHKVEKTDFDVRAKVVDNNELGELSHHFNQMTRGLKERYEILQSLAIAKEVQQNFLPNGVPAIDGLDIAGKSTYCDQTGGDYIDFIDTQLEGNRTQIFAIGDVSGHGIPSALLMASARAFLRQRLALSGTLDQIVSDVNVQFCNDVQNTGRFMTLFVCALDLDNYTLKWIRAGHDPALLYDPTVDKFSELEQDGGIPLGVDETYIYQESMIPKNTFKSGQILFIGTDGIWESRNENKEMFGKERIKKVIRDNKDAKAQKIMDNLLDDLDTFMGSCAYSDDVTLIVVKIQ
jgi:phosphoserine phosphatase RsbU/P